MSNDDYIGHVLPQPTRLYAVYVELADDDTLLDWFQDDFPIEVSDTDFFKFEVIGWNLDDMSSFFITEKGIVSSNRVITNKKRVGYYAADELDIPKLVKEESLRLQWRFSSLMHDDIERLTKRMPKELRDKVIEVRAEYAERLASKATSE